MIAVVDLYAAASAEIEAVADETEALYDSLKTTPKEDYPRIDAQICALVQKHNEIIEKWRTLRWLMNIREAQPAAPSVRS